MAGRLRALSVVCVVAVAGVCAALAAADPSAGPPICSPSTPASAIAGSYGNLVITGNRYVAADTTLTVNGNLTIAPGACLDAFTLGTVTVGGNVFVQQGAILALGCTPGSLGPPLNQPPCNGQTTNDVVRGSIVASHALTMYLDGDSIHGSVMSVGGGPGLTLDPYVNFPIKDNVIGGNVIVTGWSGAWFGLLRNTIGGSAVVGFDRGLAIGDFGNYDSTEIGQNTVHGSLLCLGNTPTANFGDSGAAPNVVYGLALGECGFGVVKPDPNYPNHDGHGGPQPMSVRPG
jgi:hypothetical protein